MNFTNWGNFIVWIVLLSDTFAIYFLIVKIKALEVFEKQGTNARTLMRERITKLEALLDEE